MKMQFSLIVSSTLSGRISRVMPVILGVLIISGCTATRMLHDAKDIASDEKSNSVFFGYDFIIPNTRIKYINFICSVKLPDKKVTYEKCFNVQAQKGNIKYKGASVFRLEFGEYSISRLDYTIITGVEKRTSTRCKKNSLGLSDICSSKTIKRDKTRVISIKPDFKKSFIVSKDNAPYIGRFHIKFDVDVKNIASDVNVAISKNRLMLTNKFEKDLLLINVVDMRKAAKKHFGI
ncbi:MAG: hypothetical protein HOG41_01060 [Gammaproteobacteria bacterium]|jgi:hypothetical protein|nr:hypothetical protein [Gammaproteobacteria bacterium]MBT4075179.1 hypothetical protein [Gammaproteobacteria bacterium]MBT4450925.1 hypothetical protein [Gammaproteobacteria bacterium]MBT4862564.1 hypothetical protein [Gammaproteobacteria bacterium]MBT7208400.1 hypothetical protein [Gammaproteobacteria bacterium]